VRVTKEISPIIIHHNPFVEGMKFEEAILPTLLLAAKVVGVEAAEFVYRRGVLRLRESEICGTTRDRCGHCRVRYGGDDFITISKDSD
jgi:hypothetical protein